MKFIHLWNKISTKVSSIEEYCNGRFMENHISFCMSDAEGGDHLFLLMGQGESDTTIDSRQNVKIDQDGDILVEDVNGNKLSLR